MKIVRLALTAIILAVGVNLAAQAVDYTRATTTQSVNVITPTDGGTVTLTRANMVNAALTPAADLSTLTISLPALPKDGDIATVTTSKNVTTVTFTGGITSGAPTSLTAGGGVSFVYTAANTTWSLANGSAASLSSLNTGNDIQGSDLYLTRQTGALTDAKVTADMLKSFVLNGAFIDPRDSKYGSNTCTGYWRISSSAVNTAGTGYAIGDTGFINSSLVGSNTTNFTVTGVDGSGGVTAYTLNNSTGSYVVANNIATTKTTGSGTGFRVNITAVTGTGNNDTTAFQNAMVDAAKSGAAIMVPNGCWISNLVMQNNIVMMGQGYNPSYGYDTQAMPALFVIDKPNLAINLNGKQNIAFIGFRLEGRYDPGAYGTTTGIGSNTGSSGFGAKIWLNYMSIKGFKYGVRPSNGYVYIVIQNSDFGANETGVAGSLSDFLSFGNTYVSGSTGLLLESGNGAFIRVDSDRFEYLVKAIDGQFINELSVTNTQIDHTTSCAITLANNWQAVNITGGAIKAGGVGGSLKITGAANNGSGLIRLTAVTAMSSFGSNDLANVSTGDTVTISGVSGTTEANGNWVLTKIDSTHFDLQGSTFTNAYTSGGYGGVWGKDANICLSGTGGARNLSLVNVGFYSSSALGQNPAPAYILDRTTSANDYIEILGGVAMSIAQSQAINYNSYSVGVANWQTFGVPSHYRFDVVGSAPFRNDNTAMSINASGALGLGTSSATTGTILDMGSSTTSALLPKGTTAQQPTAIAGMIRYNTTNSAFEMVDGVSPSWKTLNTSGTTWPTSGQVVVSNGTATPSGWSFPTSGNIVVSGGTSAPTGLVPADGLCVVGVSGSWGVGSCAGTTSSNLGTSESATSPQRTGDPTTGLYSPAVGTIGIAASGVKVTEFTSTGLDIGAAKITYNSGTNLVSFPTADSTVGASVAIGSGVMSGMTTSAAYKNTGIGYQALNGTMTTAAIDNTAIGYFAGKAITSGNTNTLIGRSAGPSITTGNGNTAIGYSAASGMRTGNNNVNIGYQSGQSGGGTNSSSNNVTIGYQSGNSLDTASSVIALGTNSYSQTSYGSRNIAIGTNTLQNAYASGNPNDNNIIGHFAASNAGLTGTGNSTLGSYAGYNMTTASNNIFSGFETGYYLSTGGGNIGIGYRSLKGSTGAATTGSNNVAIGYQAGLLVQGAANSNLILGPNVASTVLTTGSSNILLGTSSTVTTAAPGTSNYMSIGNLLKGDLSKIHRYFGGSAPAVSACGTSPAIDANATDSSGMVTAGTGSTSCTITFNQAFTSFNHCSVTAQAAVASLAYSYTTSAITITGTSLDAVKFDYRCDGN